MLKSKMIQKRNDGFVDKDRIRKRAVALKRQHLIIFGMVSCYKQLKMMSETRQLSEKQTLSTGSERKERISNITTDSLNLRLSDFSEDLREVESFCQVERAFEQRKYFQQKVKQDEITTTLHKKAINWIQTFCWTRNFAEQVLWYAVGYFYSYSYSRLIRKDRLTLILITAINLALKLFEPERVMGFETMKSLLNNVWPSQEFRNEERELLQIFGFDLYFPTVFGDIIQLTRPQDQKSKILFLAQSLFMNSYEPAINDLILEDILLIATNPESQNQLKIEINILFQSPKFMNVIKQKYASKFNVDSFLQKLLKEK